MATLLRMHTRVRVVVALSLSRDQCVFYESDFLPAKEFPMVVKSRIECYLLFQIATCSYISLCVCQIENPPRTLVSCNFKFSMACLVILRRWRRRFVLCAFMHHHRNEIHMSLKYFLENDNVISKTSHSKKTGGDLYFMKTP